MKEVHHLTHSTGKLHAFKKRREISQVHPSISLLLLNSAPDIVMCATIAQYSKVIMATKVSIQPEHNLDTTIDDNKNNMIR